MRGTCFVLIASISLLMPVRALSHSADSAQSIGASQKVDNRQNDNYRSLLRKKGRRINVFLRNGQTLAGKLSVVEFDHFVLGEAGVVHRIAYTDVGAIWPEKTFWQRAAQVVTFPIGFAVLFIWFATDCTINAAKWISGKRE